MDNQNIVGMCQGCRNAFGACTCRFKTLHENEVNINPYSVEGLMKGQVEDFKRAILKLDILYTEYGDCVKLSDILALFLREKIREIPKINTDDLATLSEGVENKKQC